MGGQTGYLGLIALPITFMILKQIFYIYDFHSKIIKNYILTVIISSLVIGLILNYLKYDIQLIIVLAGTSIVGVIVYSKLFKKGASVIETPVLFQNIWKILCIILGIFYIIVPYSPLGNKIGFGKNFRIDIIATILWIMCGMSYILLNKIVKQ